MCVSVPCVSSTTLFQCHPRPDASWWLYEVKLSLLHSDHNVWERMCRSLDFRSAAPRLAVPKILFRCTYTKLRDA
ncbi:hypothetical protein E2C01_051497 [Portunus trituberculatus]|uniref:Uncharacterized protein n=1 Tax=Portunus trituberculatus TaxID=210409 RepID=A0A5B7GIV9_PORTR|nr:hypothetical protein [Portunus trituberculatus]